MTRGDPRATRSADRSPSGRAVRLAVTAISVFVIGAACGATATGESSGVSGDAAEVVERSVRVVATHPHDTVLYTQGLEFAGGLLVESGGQLRESRVRVYDPETGDVVADRPLNDDLFGEGSTIVDDQVWQLTWKSERGFVYDLDGLEPITEFDYDGEGWGLCSFADRFVMSNGSDELTFRSLDDFSVEDAVSVRLGERPLSDLNELECVAGSSRAGSESGERIWANVYQTNMIYGIDPATGSVTDVVDLTELVPPGFEDDTDQVLNGIARHPTTGRFWITGKRWPVLYEVEFVAEQDGDG